METAKVNVKDWVNNVVKQDQIDKYLDNGQDFIKEDEINELLKNAKAPDQKQLQAILDKSMSIKTLDPHEVATLLQVDDPDMLKLMQETGLKIKQKVYDNRIVTFAPLYLSSLCVNNCSYCGFRTDNCDMKRRKLSVEEARKEAEVLAGEIGHKRLIVVYGEHPSSDANYVAETIKAIYDVKVPTRKGSGRIRRVNVNMAPISIEDLEMLRDVGIGTYQVFQETYHKETYAKVHPANTLKGNYRWRLYAMHRAMEAGVDDVGIGALFGLADWRFEVMGLIYHARELEAKFGVGPHTISFPRLEPASNSDIAQQSEHMVSDDDFKKLVTVLRLAVPHTGMIITARENADLKDEVLNYGCTQTDASTQIGIGSYSERGTDQQIEDDQQFMIGDTRNLDQLIRDLAKMGYITSFCTAGYRCGRTGACIMDMLRSGHEGKFCKLNAVLTFQEWLDDFASEETKAIGDKVILEEIEQIKTRLPDAYPGFVKAHQRILNGERDIYF